MTIMKKIILTFLTLILALSCFACDGGETSEGGGTNEANNTLTGKVDIDLTPLNDPYNTLLGFMTNPETYQGKTIAVKATNSVIYHFATNKVEHIMLGYDPTGCCNAYYPIRTADGVYPANDAETAYEGKFTSDGIIEISGYSCSEPAPNVDIDALDMSAEELRSFITNYITDYESSPYKDKTIRIMGHLVKDGGYYYFLGLNSEGKQTWFIEAFEPTGSVDIPLGVTGYLNPVELIGTLSFYSEGEENYPCITVSDANRIEGVFS